MGDHMSPPSWGQQGLSMWEITGEGSSSLCQFFCPILLHLFFFLIFYLFI